MKITGNEIRNLVLKEIESLPQDVREGVLDYLKGAGQSAGGKVSDTGRSIAKAVGNKATAAKNKIGQVAGDIKNAGATASLKGDIQKAVQDSGMAMDEFKSTFTDLLARAQSLRLNDEEQMIKAELSAIEQYLTNAGNVDGFGGTNSEPGEDFDYGDVAQDLTSNPSKPLSQVVPPSTHSDMQGREKSGEWPGGTETWSDNTPTDVDLPPMNAKSSSPIKSTKPTGQIPSPVDLGSDEPFNWGTKQTAPSKKPSSIVTGSPKKTKPTIRTKLDATSIKKAVNDAGGNVDVAAKKLGITKNQTLQALRQ